MKCIDDAMSVANNSEKPVIMLIVFTCFEQPFYLFFFQIIAHPVLSLLYVRANEKKYRSWQNQQVLR